MTFRIQPIVRPGRRRPSADDRHQQRAASLGLVLLAVVALVTVLGVGVAGYYGDHMSAVASVDGTGITRDEWLAQQKVDVFRYDRLAQQIRAAMATGQLDPATGERDLQHVAREVAAIPSTAIQELIDRTLQEKLAAQMGITVTDAEVDAQLASEGNTVEVRHVLAIFVAPGASPVVGPEPGASPLPGVSGGAGAATPSPSPTASPGAPAATKRPSATPRATASPRPSARTGAAPRTPRPSPTPTAAPAASTGANPGASATAGSSPSPSGQPTPAQQAQAQAAAEQALAALQAGAPFAQVARTYSTDPSATSGGDYGYVSASDTVDQAWIRALFSLPVGGTTSVVEGADGVYRIGRVVSIVPAHADPNFAQTIQRAGVSLAAYRAWVRGDLYRQKLATRILAQATSGNVQQVHAWEIRIAVPAAVPAAGSPAGSAAPVPAGGSSLPSGATGGPSAAPVPGASVQLPAVPAASVPAELIKPTATPIPGGSPSARASAGGAPSVGATPVAGASSAPGGSPAASGSPAAAFAPQPSAVRLRAIQQALAQPGASFAAIARVDSDAPDANAGGDMGWIAPYQVDPAVEQVLLALKVGQVSQPVTRPDGVYLYMVSERALRPVDAAQQAVLASTAFTYWYRQQVAAATIWRSPGLPAASSAADEGSAG